MIWSAIRDPGSDWNDAVAISGIPAGADETRWSSDHALTLDEEGNAYAVWREEGNVLVVNSLKAGDTTWGSPTAVAIDAPDPNPQRLRIESLSDGEALLMFDHSDDDGWRWYSAVTEDGVFGTAGPAFATTQPGWATNYASGSNGQGASLFWMAHSGAMTPEAWLVSVYRDGAWSEPIKHPVPTEAASFSSPQVVVDAAGTVMFSFMNTSGTELWLASLMLGESEWSIVEERVGTAISPDVFKEHVMALDGHGNVQLVWVQSAAVGDRVWGARRRAGSIDFESPHTLAEWDAPVQGLAIDFNAAGQGILTWWTASASERTLGYNYFR
jgi:hypothetical protein